MSAKPSTINPPPREFADWLLARGRHWVTTNEAASILGIPEGQVRQRLNPLQKADKLFSPARGGYVPIPAEYRSWGAVPASHFIDSLMHHLGHEYYVALLSAAELHGAAHQRPQAFQVMTNGRTKDREFGRVRLKFHHGSAIAERQTQAFNTPTGTMNVSTVETTVLDLINLPNESGGISNVATIIGEMIDDALLSESHRLSTAAAGYPTSVVARLGWILENVLDDTDVDLDTLAKRATQRSEPSLLLPGEPESGPVDKRWNIRINGDVEPDR